MSLPGFRMYLLYASIINLPSVELQRLEHLWKVEIMIKTGVVRANVLIIGSGHGGINRDMFSIFF